MAWHLTFTRCYVAEDEEIEVRSNWLNLNQSKKFARNFPRVDPVDYIIIIFNSGLMAD